MIRFCFFGGPFGTQQHFLNVLWFNMNCIHERIAMCRNFFLFQAMAQEIAVDEVGHGDLLKGGNVT